MLWRQRRLEQQQDEEQQHTSGGRVSIQTPLYGSADQALFGRKSNMAFRARAYKTVRSFDTWQYLIDQGVAVAFGDRSAWVIAFLLL